MHPIIISTLSYLLLTTVLSIYQQCHWPSFLSREVSITFLRPMFLTILLPMQVTAPQNRRQLLFASMNFASRV